MMRVSSIIFSVADKNASDSFSISRTDLIPRRLQYSSARVSLEFCFRALSRVASRHNTPHAFVPPRGARILQWARPPYRLSRAAASNANIEDRLCYPMKRSTDNILQELAREQAKLAEFERSRDEARAKIESLRSELAAVSTLNSLAVTSNFEVPNTPSGKVRASAGLCGTSSCYRAG